MKKQPKKLPQFMLGLKEFVDINSDNCDSVKNDSDCYLYNTMHTLDLNETKIEDTDETPNTPYYSYSKNPLRNHRRILTYSKNYDTPKRKISRIE